MQWKTCQNSKIPASRRFQKESPFGNLTLWRWILFCRKNLIASGMPSTFSSIFTNMILEFQWLAFRTPKVISSSTRTKLSHHPSFYIAALDISYCFDSVSHEKLLKLLERLIKDQQFGVKSIEIIQLDLIIDNIRRIISRCARPI